MDKEIRSIMSCESSSSTIKALSYYGECMVTNLKRNLSLKQEKKIKFDISIRNSRSPPPFILKVEKLVVLIF